MIKGKRVILSAVLFVGVILIGIKIFTYIKNKNLLIFEQQTLADFNSNKLDDSISKAQELSKKDPTKIDGLLFLATAYAQKGSVSFNEVEYSSKAIETAEKVLELDPNNAEAYRLIGYSYEIAQKYDEAQKNYLKAIELKPDLSQAYSGLGHSYDLQGDITKAEEFYRKALSLDKNNFHTLLNLARVDIRNNKPDEAEIYLKTLLESNPNNRANADAYQLLSFIENSFRDNAVKSNEYLEKSLSYDQNVPQVWVSIGMSDLASLPSIDSKDEIDNKISKIEDCVQKALAINENQTSAYLLETLLSSYLGDYKKAEEMRLKGLEVVGADITLGKQEKEQMNAVLKSINNLWTVKNK